MWTYTESTSAAQRTLLGRRWLSLRSLESLLQLTSSHPRWANSSCSCSTSIQCLLLSYKTDFHVLPHNHFHFLSHTSATHSLSLSTQQSLSLFTALPFSLSITQSLSLSITSTLRWALSWRVTHWSGWSPVATRLPSLGWSGRSSARANSGRAKLLR